MLSKFLNKYKISNKKLLVSVSGGVDSMVLCDLLIKSNLNYSSLLYTSPSPRDRG